MPAGRAHMHVPARQRAASATSCTAPARAPPPAVPAHHLNCKLRCPLRARSPSATRSSTSCPSRATSTRASRPSTCSTSSARPPPARASCWWAHAPLLAGLHVRRTHATAAPHAAAQAHACTPIPAPASPCITSLFSPAPRAPTPWCATLMHARTHAGLLPVLTLCQRRRAAARAGGAAPPRARGARRGQCSGRAPAGRRWQRRRQRAGCGHSAAAAGRPAAVGGRAAAPLPACWRGSPAAGACAGRTGRAGARCWGWAWGRGRRRAAAAASGAAGAAAAAAAGADGARGGEPAAAVRAGADCLIARSVVSQEF